MQQLFESVESTLPLFRLVLVHVCTIHYQLIPDTSKHNLKQSACKHAIQSMRCLESGVRFFKQLTMKEALLRQEKYYDTDTEITSLSQAMLDEHNYTVIIMTNKLMIIMVHAYKCIPTCESLIMYHCIPLLTNAVSVMSTIFR